MTMRAVVQRVTQATVTTGGRVAGSISGYGLVVLVGVTHSDTDSVASALAGKIYTLRILPGEKSCADTGAPLLVISQFTLYADTRKGRRPSVARRRARARGRAARRKLRSGAARAGRQGADRCVRRAHAAVTDQRRPGDTDPRSLIQACGEAGGPGIRSAAEVVLDHRRDQRHDLILGSRGKRLDAEHVPHERDPDELGGGGLDPEPGQAERARDPGRAARSR